MATVAEMESTLAQQWTPAYQVLSTIAISKYHLQAPSTAPFLKGNNEPLGGKGETLGSFHAEMAGGLFSQ